ncbi:MAG: hypothetical protein K0B05_07065 [Bacteroidales bacterium]|nr:hypothetical protein [Bacteroidales bacterium]
MSRKIKANFLIVMYITATIIASAQTRPDNPFGLVYSGAITENVSGWVCWAFAVAAVIRWQLPKQTNVLKQWLRLACLIQAR